MIAIAECCHCQDWASIETISWPRLFSARCFKKRIFIKLDLECIIIAIGIYGCACQLRFCVDAFKIRKVHQKAKKGKCLGYIFSVLDLDNFNFTQLCTDMWIAQDISSDSSAIYQCTINFSGVNPRWNTGLPLKHEHFQEWHHPFLVFYISSSVAWLWYQVNPSGPVSGSRKLVGPT